MTSWLYRNKRGCERKENDIQLPATKAKHRAAYILLYYMPQQTFLNETYIQHIHTCVYIAHICEFRREDNDL